MAFCISSQSRGNLLVEWKDNNINFNEKTYTKSITIGDLNIENSPEFTISGNNKINFLVGSSNKLIINSHNYDEKWVIQSHSNYWSNGLVTNGTVPYGVQGNNGNPNTTVVFNNTGGIKSTYNNWSPSFDQNTLNNLRTSRLYFKRGKDENTMYPDNNQTNLSQNPYSEPSSSIAYISSDPVNGSPGSSTTTSLVPSVPANLVNFTGQHRIISDLVDEERDLIGLIVSSIGKVVGHNGKKKIRGKLAIKINEALPEVELSQKHDRAVIGVISGIENDKYFTIRNDSA